MLVFFFFFCVKIVFPVPESTEIKSKHYGSKTNYVNLKFIKGEIRQIDLKLKVVLR